MPTSRRQFLQYLGAALLASAVPVQARSLSAVVVGAGMSGIAAASRLKAAGVTVTVLEARDRLGGRIWTDRSFGFPVDLGAMWMEGVKGNPIVDLARRFHVETVEDADEWIYADADGRRLSVREVEQVDEVSESVEKRTFRLADRLDQDICITDAVKRVQEPKERADAFRQRLISYYVAGLESTGGGAAERMSLWYSAGDIGFGDEDRLIPGGYLAIVEGLAQGLDVRCGQRVSAVEHTARGVRILTERGAFEADFAVLTLPLGVLKSGKVRFDPELPKEKLGAIRRLEMGLLNKVVLKFARASWPDTGNFGYLSSRHGEFPETVNWNHFAQKPVLICFVAAQFARDLEALPDQRQVEQAMAVMRKVVGKKLPDPEAFKITRWSKDPYTLGSYSYVPVGASLKDYDRMKEPVGRLLFAGEATIKEQFASVPGAYLSGVREAERALKLFR